MTKRGNAFYVPFDVLLDLRLGTLAIMDPDLAAKVVVDGYHERDSDMFKGVDYQAYREAYRARDIETLKHSYLTNAPGLINHFVGITQYLEVEKPDAEPLRMEVNYWPFELTEELRTYYHEVICELFPQLETITLIYKHPKDLSIEYCKAVYRMMFVYEYAEWLESHAKELETIQAPEMMVYAPAIYHEKVPTAKELDEMRKQIPPMHPFEATLFEVRPFVGLHLLDVRHFSLISG